MKRLLCGFAAILVIIPLVANALTAAETSTVAPPAWATPSVMALKKVTPVISAQHESTFFSNLDCLLLDYRMTASSTMQTGCFMSTAYGLLDPDTNVAIFDGTDEAVTLLPYATQQVLVPWPQADNLLSLNIINTGGVTISEYKYPLNKLRDTRNILGQITTKQLTVPPEQPILDSTGAALLANPKSLAFSSNGSWLVAETPAKSFERINLATLRVVPFAPGFGAAGITGLSEAVVAISGSGQFAAIYNSAADSLRVYDLHNCSGSLCASYDYQPFLTQQIPGLRKIRHLRFVNEGLLSFETQTSNTATSGIYELAPTAGITSLINYLGLGDSYTSGEGAFDYTTGTDTADNGCHLSARSYPLLLTHDLYGSIGGHSVACSGARINDVGSVSDSYRGQVRGAPTAAALEQDQPALLSSIYANYLPGYIAQQRFVQRYQPRVLTVSVGGNDIGFGGIIQRCAEPHISLHLSDGNCFATYEDRLEVLKVVDRTIPSWKSLYKQLQTAAPEARIYAVGYPRISSDKGDCGLNVHLSKAELEFADELTDYVNQDIQKAAVAAGVTYVDISDALTGHRLCEATKYEVAVNGLTAGLDSGVLGLKLFGKESYHPNALGQQLIEQSILRQTHNLTSAPAPKVPVATTILSAPKTGRSINTLLPVSDIAPRVVARGKRTSLNTGNTVHGLKPSTQYRIRRGGASGTVIGDAATDETGNLTGSFTLPTDTPSGGITLDITGPSQTGDTLIVTQPVIVPVSDIDSDGDGIPDVRDSCPGAVNSGVDSDHDGIDDSCDPIIGVTPIVPVTPVVAVIPPPTTVQPAPIPIVPLPTAAPASTPLTAGTLADVVAPPYDIDSTMSFGQVTVAGALKVPYTSRILGGHVLGATSNPQSISGASQAAFRSVARKPAYLPAHHGAVKHQHLRVIRWVRPMVLFVIWWALLLAIVYIVNRTRMWLQRAD